jgi:hypothetical protein
MKATCWAGPSIERWAWVGQPSITGDVGGGKGGLAPQAANITSKISVNILHGALPLHPIAKLRENGRFCSPLHLTLLIGLGMVRRGKFFIHFIRVLGAGMRASLLGVWGQRHHTTTNFFGVHLPRKQRCSSI